MAITLTLKDGTDIPLAEAGYPQHYVIANTTAEEFQTIWNKMTLGNVSEITLAEDDFTRRIIGSKLVGTQTATDTDDTITGHFYMAGGTTETDENKEFTEEETDEMAYIMANQIMLGKKTIDDIKNPIIKKKTRQVLIDLELPELAGEEVE